MPSETSGRARLSPSDRRRQLLGIGLRMLVEKPIQELSIDAVAAEAGISRGLLFHYFPTKTAYYQEVIAAALRRVWRNIAPDEDARGDEAVRQFAERFFAQIERRRESYVALVFGNGALAVGGDGVGSHRLLMARELVRGAGLPEQSTVTVHAWIAYVEDRALQWSERTDRGALADEVTHCVAGLSALLGL